MAHYSTEQKNSLVEQYLNSPLSIREFSEKEGIPKSTLYSWSKKLSQDKIPHMKKTAPSAEQRFSIVLETATLSETELSQFCREKGFYPEQIQQWKQAFISGHSTQKSTSNKADKKRIKALEKELHRKEKALAETAALLVLRKKYNALFAADEE